MQRARNKLVSDLMAMGMVVMVIMGLLSMTTRPADTLVGYHVPGERLVSQSKTTGVSLPGDGSGKAYPPGYVPPAVAAVASVDSNAVIALGRQMNAAKFGDAQWNALYQLWMRESHWNPNARNGSSGACGIPQALPCSKIPDHSVQGQITWGLNYIAARYGTPQNAWNFWQIHHYY